MPVDDWAAEEAAEAASNAVSSAAAANTKPSVAQLETAKEVLTKAMNQSMHPTTRHTAMYAGLAFLTLILLIKDYVVLEQGMDEGKNKAGQVMMISLASMNFVFFMMIGALGPDNLVVNHIWIQRMFGFTAALYILLWCLQSSWTKDGVKWGKDMTSLGKANFYLTILFILPYIPVIYRAIVGQNTTSPTRKWVVFLMVVAIAILLLVVIAEINK